MSDNIYITPSTSIRVGQCFWSNQTESNKVHFVAGAGARYLYKMSTSVVIQTASYSVLTQNKIQIIKANLSSTDLDKIRVSNYMDFTSLDILSSSNWFFFFITKIEEDSNYLNLTIRLDAEKTLNWKGNTISHRVINKLSGEIFTISPSHITIQRGESCQFKCFATTPELESSLFRFSVGNPQPSSSDFTLTESGLLTIGNTFPVNTTIYVTGTELVTNSANCTATVVVVS